jgi:hypothetical protein
MLDSEIRVTISRRKCPRPRISLAGNRFRTQVVTSFTPTEEHEACTTYQYSFMRVLTPEIPVAWSLQQGRSSSTAHSRRKSHPMQWEKHVPLYKARRFGRITDSVSFVKLLTVYRSECTIQPPCWTKKPTLACRRLARESGRCGARRDGR